MKSINTIKKFEAFYKDDSQNGHLLKNGKTYAKEVRFYINAESEEQAKHLIDLQGEDSSEFYLEETPGIKDQLGRYFPESIKDARI